MSELDKIDSVIGKTGNEAARQLEAKGTRRIIGENFDRDRGRDGNAV